MLFGLGLNDVFQFAKYVPDGHHGQRRSIMMMSAPFSMFSEYHVARAGMPESVTARVRMARIMRRREVGMVI